MLSDNTIWNNTQYADFIQRAETRWCAYIIYNFINMDYLKRSLSSKSP